MNTAIKVGVLLVMVTAIAVLSAPAQCGQWDITGKFDLKIATGAVVHVDVTPTDHGHYSANASYAAALGGGHGVDDNVFLKGDQLGFILIWHPQDTLRNTHNEYYTGTIAGDGSVSGIARVFGHLDSDTTWTTSRPMKCLYKSVNRLKIKPTTGPGSTPAATTPPFITAASAGPGKVTLTWDGGKDHPYAEIWVSVDGHDETKVLEQGKGSRDVSVKPGHNYVYILTDFGKTLATVRVQGS